MGSGTGEGVATGSAGGADDVGEGSTVAEPVGDSVAGAAGADAGTAVGGVVAAAVAVSPDCKSSPPQATKRPMTNTAAAAVNILTGVNFGVNFLSNGFRVPFHMVELSVGQAGAGLD